VNKLSPYTIPYLKKYKNGTTKLVKVKTIKWFDRPMRTINVIKNGEHQPIVYTPFNPGSRNHIKRWMEEDYSYTFPYYTAAGNVKVDVDSLEGMEHPAGKMMKRYLKVVKDQSQVGGDKGSILSKVNLATNTLHSRCDTNTAVTGRFGYSSPNIAQYPAQQEFRKLFAAPKGWSFLGSDFDGQENVVLAELLLPYDGGRLRDIIVAGDKSNGTDLHSINAKACNVTRGQSKPLWFGFLFGSSPTLTGYTLLGEDKYAKYTVIEFQAMKKKLERRVIVIEGVSFYPIKKDTMVPFTDQVVIQAIFGKHTQDKLIKSTTGLAELIKDLKAEAKENGYLTMFGGRRIEVRHAHAALNSATQGQGGEAMKYFLTTMMARAKALGLVHGVHFKLQATIYDETDYLVRNDCIDLLTEAIAGTYESISRQLGMQCTFTGEVLVSPDWWGSH